MSIDWRRLTRGAGLRLRDGQIVVEFADGRSQRVSVDPDGWEGAVRLWSFVAKPAALAGLEEDPHLFAWGRNAESDLVGFKIDRRGRMVGEAWVPTAGLDEEEWRVYVEAVAMGCDSLEYLISGGMGNECLPEAAGRSPPSPSAEADGEAIHERTPRSAGKARRGLAWI